MMRVTDGTLSQIDRRTLWSVLVLLCLALTPGIASATPWVWDQDENGLDDRLSTVALLGINWAFENLDPQGRLRFEIDLVDSILQYGAYVRYVSPPTPADSIEASFLGAQVVTVFKSVPYIRIRGLYPTLLLLATRPRVDRIEAVSLMYPLNWRSNRALGVVAGGGGPYPTVDQLSSLTGAGVVIGILDTGMNDAAIGLYPGHEGLTGKVVGGAVYDGPGPAGYTPWNASINPAQGSLGLSGYHGTHVGASAAGGDRSRLLGGVAPGARLVDVKVLGDQGSGSGVAEGLEWSIQNRNRSWSGGVSGIDILNLSFSGIDVSDGTDCISALVNAAVAQGMVVVTSAGNHADCGQLSSPGAADGAITVGAYDAGSDPGSADDALASFTAYGPRANDQDGIQVDEMKPDLVAPGVDVVSAWGSPASSGHAYASASGTSMSAALVSGIVALLLEENPSLSPSAVKQLLRDTARHRADGGLACGTQDPFGIDARYHTGWGFGQVDAVAALEELRHPNQTQFVQLAASWNEATQRVDVTWTTQREKNISAFDLERAPELNGGPGVFGTVGTTPALGAGTLIPANRTSYLVSDSAPAGGNWWYRVKTVGGNTVSPMIRVRSESPAALARLEFDHNTPESDLVLTVGSGIPQSAPAWVKPVDIWEHAISVDVPAPQDLVQHALVVPLYGDVAGTLPPLASSPWWVRAVEGGNPERTGWLRDFSVTAGGTTYDTDSNTPQATEEGSATSLWIPEPATLGIPGDHRGVSPVMAAPNPFRSRVEIDVETAGAARMSVHDLGGREVRVLWSGQGGSIHVTWDGTDARGRRLPAGAYFLRVQEGSQVRAVRLVRLP